MSSPHATNLDRVVASMRGPIEQYRTLVQELGRADVLTMTLFGMVTGASFDPARHTARNVLVLNQIDLRMLRRLAEHGTTFGKSHIAAPLIMTPAYIKTSLDTFPLELLEIQQNHLTILGEDRFDDLTFEASHIRLQCERELKTILIGLRQGLLAAAGREKFIGALEMDVGEGLIRTMRGLLWLKGQREAKPAAGVVGEIEKMTERKLAGVRAALDPGASHGWHEFENLYRDVEALGEVADAG